MSGRATRHVHALDQGSRALPPLPPTRRLCLACARRRPRFRYRGVVKADPDHTLCFQCYRAQLQRARATLMRTPCSPFALRAGRSHAELA